MTRHDIPWLSAAETAMAIKTKQVSPVEVVQAYLARIERLDEQLHAYITVLRDAALAAARQAEQTVLRGGDLGPLFGFFFFNNTATSEIYTLSLHDALPI